MLASLPQVDFEIGSHDFEIELMLMLVSLSLLAADGTWAHFDGDSGTPLSGTDETRPDFGLFPLLPCIKQSGLPAWRALCLLMRLARAAPAPTPLNTAASLKVGFLQYLGPLCWAADVLL